MPLLATKMIHLSSRGCTVVISFERIILQGNNAALRHTRALGLRTFNKSRDNESGKNSAEKEEASAIWNTVYTKRLIVSYCWSVSLIIMMKVIFPLQRFDISFLPFFFHAWRVSVTLIRRASWFAYYAAPAGPARWIYSVIYAGYGGRNQQSAHVALICRIAALVRVILLSVVIEICNFFKLTDL